MSQDLYVVTAATGHIGSRLTETLLAAGKKVRAVTRDANKLKSLAEMGAEIVVSNVTDTAALTRAFTGAKAVFTLIPPNYVAPDILQFMGSVARAYVSAIESAKVPYVVNLSSVGAHLGKGAGVVDGLYTSEQLFNKIAGLNVLHLRPSFFLENLFFGIGVIKHMGIHGTAFKPDLKVAMIATRDIAEEAAARLLTLDFKGSSVKELFGQRDISMAEATGLIGKAIGKLDLKYVQFPYDETEKALLAMGMTPNAAQRMIELYRGTNDGLVKPTQPRSAATTTRTTIEEFVENDFAQAYKAS